MSGATPRPWRVNKYGSIGAGEFGTEPIIAHVEPFYGSDIRFGSHDENADLIVRAVNSHDALVAALADLLAENDEVAQASYGPGDEWRQEEPEHFALCERARAALARARGERP